jgi:hypothetical protein
MNGDPAAWHSCSTCRGDIGFEEPYYVCSVSTCTRNPTDFRFCSVECWETHAATLRHRDACPVEKTSPNREEWLRENPPRPLPDREIEEESEEAVALNEEGVPRDVLVVISKLKGYIRARSGMNTSDAVIPLLSDHLRRVCDRAIRRAARDGRKTVMDRDFDFLR